ncbi:sulfite exporter TauE/SafE family protein [Ramlibacter algicola]|uniref:Probable membrane transporter protein n=1 Tax=Ramlibacter algicola TaxID=2795217 RepID=A0A934Q090_9BURK|nr:sulfite exporter TauE/SafE family protein [Ramlibacter algicola]MBK0392790.1 sulfite exporter TauE/SafE family protein [Ramlibacter algicola]
MFHDSLPDFTAIALIFLVAGAVKGILGLGLPTVALGLLGLVMPVPAAAALMTVPSLVTNVWQAAVGPGLRALLARTATLQVGIVAGVLAAGVLLPEARDEFGRRLLGGCLVAYGLLGAMGRRLPPPPPRWEPLLGGLVGATTGVVTAFTGVFVLPAVPYLQSLGLDKDALTQALGIGFTTSTLALAGLLATRGHFGVAASASSALMVLPALAGMWFGQQVRGWMSEAAFRRSFFFGLLALGDWLLLR